MIGTALAAVVSAWLTGTLIVAALWPRDRPLVRDLPLILPLGLGFGLGATSACFFAVSLVAPRPLLPGVLLELAVAAAAGTWLWRQRRHAAPAAAAVPLTAAPHSPWPVLLGSIFAQVALLALVGAVRAYHLEPYSNSDGWTIWNMHARFLFRGGTEWPALLRAPQLAWTHPDYPLLVPASVARAWSFVGTDAPFAAGLVSTLFGIATVGLLVAAVARLRQRAVAAVGGLVLLGTPFFVTFSSNQHADIPLGFHLLSAVTLLALHRPGSAAAGLPALLGAAAGLAAWTKNEGILFVLIVTLVWGSWALRHRSWRDAGGFLAGLAVALLPVLGFKLLSPANDLVSSEPIRRLGHLLDWSRHELILSSLGRDLGRFGEWAVIPFAVMVLPLLGSGWRRMRSPEWLVAAVLLLTLLGYYGVYLLTPWELASHLDSSLVRLLIQLWPGAIFFWCLAVTYEPATTVAATQPTVPPRRKWILVASATLIVAAGVLIALNRQLAANELAAATIDGARVHVLLGDGWFGRETLSDDRWAWSKGESTLLMRVDGGHPRTVNVRFTIRSLGSRTLTANMDGREIWRAHVRDGAESFEITRLRLPAGVTPLVFHTDAPGVPESAEAGARALTYAIYNPEVAR